VYKRVDGSTKNDKAWLVDFSDVRANDWLAVNQFTVIEGQHNRRPDIVVFVNGLPLGLIELKNAADEDATIWSAYAQLQTYKAEISSLLHYNAALVVSDGLQARMGSLTANQEWFKVWRTIDGEGDAPKSALELEVLVRGVFERQRFLDLLQQAGALIGQVGCTAASPATAAQAWSGTRRAAASPSPCSSMPPAWCGIQQCRTRRWWC
jgi:type I restriction enzyme R subunit